MATAKKSDTPAAASDRVAITATGVALLAMLADAGGSLMLTQAEGAGIINDGFATVDTSIIENDTAQVTLTDAGRAELDKANGADDNGTADGAAASGGSSSFEIEDNVAMPTDATRRGRSGGYPFDKLNVGQSFHVAKTTENPNPAERLASSVSGARAKFAIPDGDKTETVTVKEYQRAEGEGKGFAKDADGKRIVVSSREETRPAMKVTRDFTVKSVGADDPKGEGARVWRTA
jgi:hypothetical protein